MKLHKHFGHPEGSRLINLIESARITDIVLLDTVRLDLYNCSICLKYTTKSLDYNYSICWKYKKQNQGLIILCLVTINFQFGRFALKFFACS